MKNRTEINADITRLVIPFKDIYTSVFIIKTPAGAVVFDTATYDSDVEDYILPALAECGKPLCGVIVSHAHGDHVGGLPRLMREFPQCPIVSRHADLLREYPGTTGILPASGDTLFDVLKIYSVPGHTGDSLAVLDTRTGTLITGDSLQSWGIYGSGAWGANIRLIAEHLAALDVLRALDVQVLAAAHDYHPYGNTVTGREAYLAYIDSCEEALYRIRKEALLYPEKDAKTLAAEYNAKSGLPKVGAHVFDAVRAATEDGQMPKDL